MYEFEVGEKLEKNWDKRIVIVEEVRTDFIVLDGDFEPNHVVMKEKVSKYYSRVNSKIKDV